MLGREHLIPHLPAHTAADGDADAVVGAQQHARLRQRRCISHGQTSPHVNLRHRRDT